MINIDQDKARSLIIDLCTQHSNNFYIYWQRYNEPLPDRELLQKIDNIIKQYYISFLQSDKNIYYSDDTQKQHYHELLDRAMSETKEGESLLTEFTRLIIAELM